MAGRLDKRVAIVTGGASGIGAATATLFAQEGANVFVCDVNEAGAEQVAAAIRADGGEAHAVRLDVTSESDWSDAFDLVDQRHGRADVLMNVAGLFRGGPLEHSDLVAFDSLVAVNLKGVYLGCREAVRRMKSRPDELPWASIVNVSSTAGFIGTPNSSIYTMTKGGVRLFSKAVAVEAAHYGYRIRCNSLHPGGTDTAMFDGILAERGMTREQQREAARTRNPMGRMAEPIEIAYGALFLASDESRFMTGSELALDGGYAAR